ncbi:hypothetical protein B7463_g1456, partial [Scytalidium lignicola]
MEARAFLEPRIDLASANVNTRKTTVLVSTTIVLVVSHLSYILRLWARKKSTQKIMPDDWVMGAALPFSWIPAVCLYYGLTVGLGEHQGDVSKADLKKFNISLFVLQRGNPPCLFCIKTSILMFYTRIFRTSRTFRRVALGAWIYTLLWAIAAFFSNMLQCLPVSFFWDKDQPGSCLPNALITIGLTNGVLSFVGDLFILAMPVPMVWKLQIDKRRKLALIGIFLLGGFVCLASVLRFIALLSINVKDITFTQVDPGIWTYLELGIGITSGNLPLLRPLFGNLMKGNSKDYSSNIISNGLASGNRLGPSTRSRNPPFDPNGFERMTDRGIPADDESLGDTGSEIELRRVGEGINVKTDINIKVEEQSLDQQDSHTNGRGMGMQAKDGIRTMVKGLM